MSGEKHSRIKPLSIEEEQSIKVFYENKLQEVCNNFHFPHKIQVYAISSLIITATLFFCNQFFEIVYVTQATALIFFKRFYLQWSVMEHQPKNIM